MLSYNEALESLVTERIELQRKINLQKYYDDCLKDLQTFNGNVFEFEHTIRKYIKVIHYVDSLKTSLTEQALSLIDTLILSTEYFSEEYS